MFDKARKRTPGTARNDRRSQSLHNIVQFSGTADIAVCQYHLNHMILERCNGNGNILLVAIMISFAVVCFVNFFPIVIDHDGCHIRKKHRRIKILPYRNKRPILLAVW